MLLEHRGDGLIPHTSPNPERLWYRVQFNLPVDDMHDSGHPDEKSSPCMLAVIFRPNVKSGWCQSHSGDISIFLEGQAVTANPPPPLPDGPSLCLDSLPTSGRFLILCIPNMDCLHSFRGQSPCGRASARPTSPCHHVEDAASSPGDPDRSRISYGTCHLLPPL